MPEIVTGKILDFRRDPGGAGVEVDLQSDADGSVTTCVVTPEQFRELVDPECRALFDEWWGKVELS